MDNFCTHKPYTEEKAGRKNPYAIYFSINDAYSFAVATVIMGLKRYSPNILESCDIIIYHNGVTEKNQKLLQQLHSDVYFRDMDFPPEYDAILEHRSVSTWGPYIVAKLFGFDLIHEYDRVLFLDADMLVRGDITPLFQLDSELAWCKLNAWNPNEVFAKVLAHPDDYISAGNGGLLCFSDKLKKYHIDHAEIARVAKKLEVLKKGGIDETILAWLVYEKRIVLEELDRDFYNTPARRTTEKTIVVHFLNHFTSSTKPWKNLAAYLYFKDWAGFYERWLQMGGEGPIAFTDADYYNLFGFDQAKQIEKLAAQLKMQDPHNEKTRDLMRVIRDQEREIAELKRQIASLRSSTSWKITKPLRSFSQFLRKSK